MTNATEILPLRDFLTKGRPNWLANRKFDRMADVAVGSSGGRTLAKHDCLPVYSGISRVFFSLNLE